MAASSAAPRGAPCAIDLPSLVGAPKPMRVRAAMSVGRSDARAADRAQSMAAGSWPSTASVVQFEASNRLRWSSELETDGAPLIVVWLSSKIRVSLASSRWPASESASWLTPSIRQPSPQNTQVRWSDEVGAEFSGQHPLRNRHADRRGETLAEGPVVISMPGSGHIQGGPPPGRGPYGSASACRA